jgi:hypothetical protein
MPAVHALVALAALRAGDHALAQRVLDDAGASSLGTDPLSRLYDVVGAVAAVVVSDAAPPAMAALEDRFATLTDCHLLYARVCSLLVAHALLDLGNPLAVRFAGHVLDLPETGPVVRAETELLRCRLSVVGGQPVTAEQVLAHAGRVAASGQARHAAVQTLRLADDLARSGSSEEAAVLSEWGTTHLPGPKRRTPMEQHWCDRVARYAPDGRGDRAVGRSLLRGGTVPPGVATFTVTVAHGYETPAHAAPSARVAIRLLHPVPSVEVSGRETSLPDSQARLVVFMVLAHPRPLHVEQLGDRLWPDVPLHQVRVRLNSLLYRLRRSLGSTSDELIDRSGDLVRLRPDVCTVDLLALWAQVAGGGTAAGAALASVRSNLCPAQDPYDEHLIEARRQFAGEWTAQARRAMRQHLVTIDELAAAAQALDVGLDELTPPDR